MRQPVPGHRDFHAGQRGVSYRTLFEPYLSGATAITVIDPYIRARYQVRHFIELLALIASGMEFGDEVDVHLVTTPEQDHDKYLIQGQLLYKLQHQATAYGIRLTIEMREPGEIHDRRIESDTGWRIDLGRGLDIWNRPEDGDPFAVISAELRTLRSDFTVHYLRTGPHPS